MSQASLALPMNYPQDDGLRFYQRECVNAIHQGFLTYDSLLVVMATGLGKTRIFSTVAKEWQWGDVLILAHRDELIMQGRDALESLTGEMVDIEKAAWTSSERSRLVFGSVQSVMQKGRLERLGKDRFGLVIIDEAHHSPSKSYRKILNWFRGTKVLGVTATPDRADEKAMGVIFDEVAYCMDIGEGIDAGYLVPIDARQVPLDTIDLSGVDVSKGDFVDSQLDDVMVKSVEGIVAGVLEYAADRKGILFFPGCKSAEYACHKFNEIDPDSTCYIDGKTDPWIRKGLIKDLRLGRYKRLCNCDIATEGFDWPEASLIVPRLTMSRNKFAQQVGRGTRVPPGVVDTIPGEAGASRRIQAIADSRKPNMLLLDFVGNAGKHSLCTPEDLLGGDYNDEEISLAKKKRKEAGGEGNAQEFLRHARAQLQELARRAKAQVKFGDVRAFDPFLTFGMPVQHQDRWAVRFGTKPAERWQLDVLKRGGMEDRDLEGISKQAAGRLLDEMKRRHTAGLCTYRQLRQLKRFGVVEPSVPFSRAQEALTYISKTCQWNPRRVDGSKLNEILFRVRQPGDDA